MPSPRKLFSVVLLILALASLLTYWGWLLHAGVWQDIAGAFPDVARLARYLLGIIFLLTLFWLVAHLNYRLAFRRWLLRTDARLYYWTWECVLAGLLFEVLQFRTEHDPEFVDENLLVTNVLMAFIVGYGYAADSFSSRREQVLLIQQRTEAELTALKAQVNPHFLFNALNTIYNQAQLANDEPVAELIQHLSGIMRFTLQEATKQLTSIENEIQFLEKYLALQRARLPNNGTIQVSTRLDWDGQPAQIAPLLLIPFVENAFQYGISMVQPSYLEVNVNVENNQLQMQVANGCPRLNSSGRGMGTGIANARQRLALMYPARHELMIRQTTDSFVVRLTIDL